MNYYFLNVLVIYSPLAGEALGVQNALGEYMDRHGCIDFNSVKPVDWRTIGTIEDLREWNMENWGCQVTGNAFRIICGGRALEFTTIGGIPTKIISRISAQKRLVAKLFSRYSDSDSCYVFETLPAIRQQSFSRILNVLDIPSAFRRRLCPLAPA